MRVLNKSSSTPSLVPQLPEKGKSRKHKLQELQNDVNKSRIAIENMSHTRALESSLYHKVEQLQKQLHKCIVSLNSQSQKQRTLTELTGILKGQMSAVQAVQKTSAQFVSSGIQKKVKKVEYDIKQILHKYNQEVAKINLLKEQANAARDERVVYSNLFNKIEKEIKHYQEIYKQTLIKNQIFLDKKRNTSLQNNQESYEEDLIDESLDRCQTIELAEKKSFKLKEQASIKMTEGGQTDPFLTNPQAQYSKTQNLSSGLSFYKDNVGTMTPHKSNSQSRGIENAIKNKEAQIEAIVVHAQCRSLEQCLQLFKGLDRQNQRLIEEIGQFDENIDYIEHQISRLIKQKRSSAMYQNRQLSEMVNISKNSRSHKAAIKEYQYQQPQYFKHITSQICKLLKIDSQNLGDDVLRQIDTKIESLGCTIVKKHERRESKILPSEDTSDRGVCQLLQKIDKFGQSQKIYDKNMLRAEYHKEVNKVRKRGKRSN